MISSKEFEFNMKMARRTVAIFIISSLAFLLLVTITNNKISNNFLEYWELFTLLFFVYLVILFILLKKLYLTFFGNKEKIIVDSKKIHIPTFHLGSKDILVNDLYSIEDFGWNEKVLGVVLGVKRKGKYLIEKQRFKHPDDFDEFKLLIKEILEFSTPPERKQIIDRLANSQRFNSHSIATYFVAFLAIGMFYLSTNGNFEYSGGTDFLYSGANTKETLYKLELFRVATSTFIHGSLFHLLLNIVMLAVFSELLEKVISYVRFSNIFLFSSCLAVFISSAFSPFDASIGASGGLFGLWGAHTYLKLKYDEFLPGSINAIPLSRVYIILCVELILEIFVVKNIDYFNHIGGFFAGLLYMSLIPLGPKLETINQPTTTEKSLFVVLTLAYAIGLTHFLALYYGFI